MHVWDAAGGTPLAFDADALGQPQLGWIVENGLLVDALWNALPAAGVRVHCPARVETLEQDDGGVRLGLDDGLVLEARLAIAADGGHSALRKLTGIDAKAHDYGQRGLVAFVASEAPHRDTCWQRFLPTGPVALLPFNADGDAALEGRLGSIVWTLPDADAQRLLDAPPEQFERELSAAFGGELGGFKLHSARAAFPLRRQLAQRQVEGRVLLVGDAAHVMHPLAGQGVNHGLRDVSALREMVRDAQARGGDIASTARLARWARVRRSENALGAYSFEAINRLYSNDALLPTLLRGHALGLAGRTPPLVRALWRHAAGV
jgi:2-octaprenyl-3-methyl-6-methoxy-1,4-benzoquinol hydroxylase